MDLKSFSKLMDISPDLARLNRDRFRAFSDAPSARAIRPAALAFAGDTCQEYNEKQDGQPLQHFSILFFVRNDFPVLQGDDPPGFFHYPGIVGGENKGDVLLPV